MFLGASISKKKNLINEIFKINKIGKTRILELSERNILANLKEELDSILVKEEIMRKQRSRV